MPRKYAQVKVSIWVDDDFRALSDGAQALYFRLLTSARLNFCGVTDWRPKRLAQLASGLTERRIIASGEELAAAGFVVIDDDAEEVLVRTFVRHDGVLASPNLATALVNDFGDVLSGTIRRSIVTELHRLYAEQPDLKGWPNARELLGMEPLKPTLTGVPGGVPEGVPEGVSEGISLLHPSLIPSASTPTLSAVAAAEELTEEFDRWYSVYPRKIGRKPAEVAYRKARKRTSAETLLAGARVMSTAYGRDTRYCPHPSTWLNQDRWTDDAPTDAHGTPATATAPRRDALGFLVNP